MLHKVPLFFTERLPPKMSVHATATYVACHTSINAVQGLSDILQEEMGAFEMQRTECSCHHICSSTTFQRGVEGRC